MQSGDCLFFSREHIHYKSGGRAVQENIGYSYPKMDCMQNSLFREAAFSIRAAAHRPIRSGPSGQRKTQTPASKRAAASGAKQTQMKNLSDGLLRMPGM
jgi:hypothetical protein